jgi:carbon starvation protein
VVGIMATNPSINLPAFPSFTVAGTGNLFPILFVTIACGAVSGFHALVSSGTASKQIKNEKHMLPVSFGAMLIESLLAVISLIAVASFAAGEAAAAGYSTPTQVFAGGVANFLEKLGMPHNIIFTLINLAVSAFALTSLDSVARIGRLSFQELFLDASIKDEDMKPWRKVVTNKYFATVITLVLAYILAKMGYKNIWPLFGSANQLLSALALIACAVYLKKTNRKGWMLWIPMVIMLCVTLTALVQKIIALIGDPTAGNILQLAFAVALFVLGVIVAVLGFRRLAEKTPQEAQNA